MTIKKVVIIGKGSWGGAIAHALSFLANTEIHSLGHQLDSNLLELSDVIIIAVPSSACTDILMNLQQFKLNDQHIILIASKGLSPTAPFLFSELAAQLLPCKIGVISGPSFANEVKQNIFTSIDIAIKDNHNLAIALSKNLSTQNFRINPEQNIYALQIAGCMKNILAIWAGIAAGSNLGHNTLSYILTLGLRDIAQLTAVYNSDIKIDSLSIFGDYYLTTTSPQSRNYSFGRELAQQTNIKNFIKNYPTLVEGLHATYLISKLSKLHNIQLPLIEFLLDIFEEQDNIHHVVRKLLKLN